VTIEPRDQALRVRRIGLAQASRDATLSADDCERVGRVVAGKAELDARSEPVRERVAHQAEREQVAFGPTRAQPRRAKLAHAIAKRRSHEDCIGAGHHSEAPSDTGTGWMISVPNATSTATAVTASAVSPAGSVTSTWKICGCSALAIVLRM